MVVDHRLIFLFVLSLVIAAILIPISIIYSNQTNKKELNIITNKNPTIIGIKYDRNFTGTAGQISILTMYLARANLDPNHPKFVLFGYEPLISLTTSNSDLKPIIPMMKDRPGKKLLEDTFQKYPPGMFNWDTHRRIKELKSSINLERRKGLHDAFVANFMFESSFTTKMDSIIGASEKPILGVHIRSPVLFEVKTKVTPTQHVNYYFKVIDPIIDKYKKIFVATHTQEIMDLMKKKYLDKIMFVPHYLNPDGLADWPSNKIDDKTEHWNLFADIYCLSKTDFLVCGPSNVSHMVLYLNPTIQFTIPKELEKDSR